MEVFGIKHEVAIRTETKSSESLVLWFDTEGKPSFKNMTRTDVMEVIQQQVAEFELKDFPILDSTKTGFCDVQKVHARDLRKLDAAFAVSNEPSMMVRKQAILINADPIRAVVMKNVCLVFVPDGADSLLSTLKAAFREHSQDQHSPFEFRAIEATLATLCRTISTELERFFPHVTQSLDRLSDVNLSSGELEQLRGLKNTVSEFDSQVNGIRRALMDILDNEQDLRLLHLTKLFEHPDLVHHMETFDPEDAEVLLEIYLQDIHTTRSKVALMQRRIQNTESLVMLKLDSVRNYLLAADVIFSLVSTCMTVGMFVTGAFGMNLRSGLEESDTTSYFWSVVTATIAFSICVSIIGIQYFKARGVLVT